MPHCLVTGGAGFIGSHLAEGLLRQGHQVTVLDNLSTGKLDNLQPILSQIRYIQADIRYLEEVESVFADVDVIYHQAACSSVTESIENPHLVHENNVAGTLNVLEAARRNGVKKMVFASSAAIYGSDSLQPRKEHYPAMPIHPYGLSKYIGELYSRMYSLLYDMEIVCLRYFNVYGPRQNPKSQYSGVITNFVNQVLANESPVIYGDGFQTRDFIYVEDIVQANLLALKPMPTAFSVYNVASGNSITLHQLIEALSELTGRALQPEYRPERRKDIRHSLANIELIHETLGFTPSHEFKAGLQAVLEASGLTHANMQKLAG